MSDFEDVGTIEKASTERSLRIDLKDNPFTCPYYVSIKDLESVIRGTSKTVTVWSVKTKKTKFEKAGC